MKQNINLPRSVGPFGLFGLFEAGYSSSQHSRSPKIKKRNDWSGVQILVTTELRGYSYKVVIRTSTSTRYVRYKPNTPANSKRPVSPEMLAHKSPRCCVWSFLFVGHSEITY